MRKTLSILVIAALGGTATAQPDPTPAPTPAPDPAPTPAEVPKEVPMALPEKPTEEPAKKDDKKKAGTAGFDKGFYIKSPDDKFSMKISARVQPFYTLAIDRDPTDFKQQFEVRRTRLVLEGNVFTKHLTYKTQTDFARGFVLLRDAHFDVEAKKDVWLRVGQWKRPFSRQQINSSGRLEITDRAITDKAWGAGRDIGIAIHNGYEKSPDLEWTVGVFNGTGEGARFVPTVDSMGVVNGGSFTNLPGKMRPVVVGRVGINRNGIKGYSEADLEGGPLRWGAGASVALEGDNDDNDVSNQKAELDYIVKVNGISTTGGVYLLTDQDPDVGMVDSKLTDFGASLVGFHLQGGYMLNKNWQASLRYALVNDPRTKAVTAKDQQEISIGGNYYAFGHDAKLVGALRFIKTGDGSFRDGMLIEIGANVGF